MLFSNPVFKTWYTDSMDIYRVVEEETEDSIEQNRKKVNEIPIPCRVYSTQGNAPQMSKTAGKTTGTDKLSCDIDVDIQAGDEIQVIRGGNIGKSNAEEQYFAGKSQLYHDPVGGVLSGLGHKETPLLRERIN